MPENKLVINRNSEKPAVEQTIVNFKKSFTTSHYYKKLLDDNYVESEAIKKVCSSFDTFCSHTKGCIDYSVIGFTRVNGIIGKKYLPDDRIANNSVCDKQALYDKNRTILDKIREEYHVYLSRVSLEEDLDEAIHKEMVDYLPDANGDVVSYLKDAKKYNMVELVEKLTDDDCKKIMKHYNFKCLEDILK